MSILAGDKLVQRLIGDAPLVSPIKDIQIQPDGVELTMQSIATLNGAGRLAFDNAERELPKYDELPFDADGWVFLKQGIYIVTYNEVVNIHRDLFAIGRPRSSILRMGASIYTALWDTGYVGRSQTPLNVINPAGLHLKKNARLMQLVFFSIDEELDKVYDGNYQGENV